MNNLGAAGIIIIAVLLIIFMPFAIIWAVNTLFGLGIAYTFWTWLATVVLTGTFGKANVTVKRD